MFGLDTGGGGFSGSSGVSSGPQDARLTATNSLGNITFGAKNSSEKWLYGALGLAIGLIATPALKRRKGR